MTSWCLIKAACTSLYDLLLLRCWRLEWSNLNNSEIPFFYSQRVSLSPKIMPLCESHPRNIYFIMHIVFQGEVNHCFEVFFIKFDRLLGLYYSLSLIEQHTFLFTFKIFTCTSRWILHVQVCKIFLVYIWTDDFLQHANFNTCETPDDNHIPSPWILNEILMYFSTFDRISKNNLSSVLSYQ